MAQPWLRIPLPRIQRSEMKRKWLSLSASRLCLRQRKGPRQKDQETKILALTATSPSGDTMQAPSPLWASLSLFEVKGHQYT